MACWSINRRGWTRPVRAISAQLIRCRVVCLAGPNGDRVIVWSQGAMYRCPSCYERGISFWNKQFYTMWTLPTCQLCGRKARLSIPWVFLYSILLFLVGMPVLILVFFLVAGYVGSEGGVIGGLLAAVAVAFLLASAGFHLLPLVPKR